MEQKQKIVIRQLILTGTLSLVAGICLTGCGGTSSDFSRGNAEAQTISAEPENDKNTDRITKDVKEKQRSITSALQQLRQSMEGTSETFATAYLGYVEADNMQDITGWLLTNCPTLCENYDFLTDIPAERIAGSGPAELFCIIPKNPETSVEVNHMAMNMEEGIMEPDACLYRADSGEPFFILCNGAYDGINQTQILLQDASGNQTEWYPMMGEGGRVMIPTTEDYSYLAKDITEYSELGVSRFYDWYGNMWTPVTAEQLQNTNWQIYMDVTQDLSAQYSIDFYPEYQMRLEWYYTDVDTPEEGFHTAEEEYSGSWSLIDHPNKTILQLDTVQSGGRWYLEGKDIRNWQLQGDLYISENEDTLLLHVNENEKVLMPGNDAQSDTVLLFRVYG